MTASVAKIFQNGQSQAVRLPKEFRFDTDEVFISREGDKVVLLPKPRMTWDDYFAKYGPDPDFTLERPDNGEPQEREMF
ncbi:MAG: type II toxin-antitoxin system VapB family antitoxin [Synergistaceae bacterium]|jgi:antitoxin VapB|nr:type II toxin-antitoxin system VapB family antitoxin [Synergistaceae bacterium]